MRRFSTYLLFVYVFASLLMLSCRAKKEVSKSHPTEIPTLQSLHIEKDLKKTLNQWLGAPYKYGGNSKKGVDCSGFVCWVINNCGNGWNVGRTTADGLRSYCSYVSPSDAKPGDLIFFQGTYDTPGASHVGIYVGNNMMIHCGNPIQYTSIASSYWQQHFMAFGRLH